MYIAYWMDTEIARSNKTIEVEGNQYFPKEDVEMTFMQESNYHTTCPWKGLAHYYTIIIKDQKNDNAAWYYPDPKEAASNIKDYIAFWKGVKITKVEG